MSTTQKTAHCWELREQGLHAGRSLAAQSRGPCSLGWSRDGTSRTEVETKHSRLLVLVTASLNSLAWFFLEWGYVKSEETASGNAFSKKISFFFSSPSNHLCDGTTPIQTTRCDYPSGLSKDRTHRQDKHWSRTKTLILKTPDRTHAPGTAIALKPQYSPIGVRCVRAVLLITVLSFGCRT